MGLRLQPRGKSSMLLLESEIKHADIEIWEPVPNGRDERQHPNCISARTAQYITGARSTTNNVTASLLVSAVLLFGNEKAGLHAV